jgi:hypothetical protein
MKKLSTLLKIILNLLLIFTFFNQNASAQEKEFGFAGLSIGPSIPFGEFAKSDPNNDNSGYATIGGKASLKFGLNLSRYYGLVSIFFVNINGTDADPLRERISQQNPGFDWTIDSKNWRVSGGMLGFRSRLPTKNITYHFEVFGGGLNSYSPEITATAITGQGTNTIKLENKIVWTFAYIVGAGISYEIGNNFSLTGNVEFLGADPRFNDVRTTKTIGGTTTTSTVSYNQSYNAFNILLGLKYSFM